MFSFVCKIKKQKWSRFYFFFINFFLLNIVWFVIVRRRKRNEISQKEGKQSGIVEEKGTRWVISPASLFYLVLGELLWFSNCQIHKLHSHKSDLIASVSPLTKHISHITNEHHGCISVTIYHSVLLWCYHTFKSVCYYYSESDTYHNSRCNAVITL